MRIFSVSALRRPLRRVARKFSGGKSKSVKFVGRITFLGVFMTLLMYGFGVVFPNGIQFGDDDNISSYSCDMNNRGDVHDYSGNSSDALSNLPDVSGDAAGGDAKGHKGHEAKGHHAHVTKGGTVRARVIHKAHKASTR